MKLNITGHRILIKPEPLEETTKGGLVIARPRDQEKMERRGSEIGTVMAIGPTAWAAFDRKDENWKPWCKEGDKIFFVRYAGRFITDKDTNEEFVVINDEDVLAVIGETNE